jgi:uncharacterized protein YqgC (DUF456 family)
MLNILIYILLAILSLAGLILTVLNFPGVWLIYISTVILSVMDGFDSIPVTTLVILFVVSVLSTFIDNIVVAMGTKKMGGSIWGMIGAILGGIVGVVVGGIPGMFLGPLLGAVLLEYTFSHKDINQSFKAGIGSAIGVLVGIALRIAINIGMIIFTISALLK